VILKTGKQRDDGDGIAQNIPADYDDVLQVEEGCCYRRFKRLQTKRMGSIGRGHSANNRRERYTPNGQSGRESTFDQGSPDFDRLLVAILPRMPLHNWGARVSRGMAHSRLCLRLKMHFHGE